MSKNNPVRVMDSPGRPVLPPQAEAEILDRLFTDTRISSGEIAAILEKYDVRGDERALQDAYRKRLGQRLIASIRDESGKREVLAHGSEYMVVDCCNDRQALKAIRRRIQGQMSGLDVSAAKVQGRVRVLDRLLAVFRKRGDGR